MKDAKRNSEWHINIWYNNISVWWIETNVKDACDMNCEQHGKHIWQKWEWYIRQETDNGDWYDKEYEQWMLWQCCECCYWRDR